MRTSVKPLLLAAFFAGVLLTGCSSQKVDVSSGDYGKADATTQLPPQPNPQDIAKRRAANPQGAGQQAPAAR